MINFIKSSFFTFTIWVVTALVNSLLYAVIFSLGNMVQDNFIETAGIVFFFSLLISVPAVFALWIVFLTSCQNELLTRILLRTVFILSLFTVVAIRLVPNGMQKGHWPLQAFIVMVSAIISVMLHHPFLKSFFHPQRSSHV
jgi:hypothetical protein